jgi:hypothetical protein
LPAATGGGEEWGAVEVAARVPPKSPLRSDAGAYDLLASETIFYSFYDMLLVLGNKAWFWEYVWHRKKLLAVVFQFQRFYLLINIALWIEWLDPLVLAWFLGDVFGGKCLLIGGWWI